MSEPTKQKIHFKKRTDAEMKSMTLTDDTVYFNTTTHEMFVGEDKYSGHLEIDENTTTKDSAGNAYGPVTNGIRFYFDGYDPFIPLTSKEVPVSVSEDITRSAFTDRNSVTQFKNSFFAKLAIVEDSECGTMTKLPKFYYSASPESAGSEEQFALMSLSMDPRPGYIPAPAFQDRNDGQGERDYILLGKYFSNSTGKSAANQTIYVPTNYADATAKAEALGTDVYLMDYAAFQTLAMLYFTVNQKFKTEGIAGPDATPTSLPLTGQQPTSTASDWQVPSTNGSLGEFCKIEGLFAHLPTYTPGLFFTTPTAEYPHNWDLLYQLNPEDWGVLNDADMVGPHSRSKISGGSSSGSNFNGYAQNQLLDMSTGWRFNSNMSSFLSTDKNVPFGIPAINVISWDTSDTTTARSLPLCTGGSTQNYIALPGSAYHTFTGCGMSFDFMDTKDSSGKYPLMRIMKLPKKEV